MHLEIDSPDELRRKLGAVKIFRASAFNLKSAKLTTITSGAQKESECKYSEDKEIDVLTCPVMDADVSSLKLISSLVITK